MTYYGRWTYKYEEAARQGAKACLIIHNTAAASYPFSVVQNSWGSSNLYLDKRGSDQYHCALQGWVSADATKKLLAAAGKDSSLLMQANNRGFKAISLGEKLSTKVRVKAVYKTSQNVIAKITGLKDRMNIFFIQPIGIIWVSGSRMQKAIPFLTGRWTMPAEQRHFWKWPVPLRILKVKPERTILFLSVTGEEQGLLGSEYYGQHPIYPLKKTVADLNMDVISPNEKTNDIVITGYGQNELENDVEEIGKIQGPGQFLSKTQPNE